MLFRFLELFTSNVRNFRTKKNYFSLFLEYSIQTPLFIAKNINITASAPNYFNEYVISEYCLRGGLIQIPIERRVF